MFPATTVTVVLLLAAGPSAPLFCKAWCDPHVAAESGCHHEDNRGAPGVRSDDSCDDSVQGLAGVLKEDHRRAPAPGDRVVFGARFRVIPPDTQLVLVESLTRRSFRLNQPQTTPLRI